MPCGARLEVVETIRESDEDVTSHDHVEVPLRVLPILERRALDDLVRDELAARGWEREPDGSLAKQFGDAVATLPAGASAIRLAVVEEGRVSVSVSEKVSIAEGDEAARARANARADEKVAAKLALAAEQARARLVQENIEKLQKEYEAVREEAATVVNTVTRRALEQRARAIGAIESLTESRGADGGYELSITVKT